MRASKIPNRWGYGESTSFGVAPYWCGCVPSADRTYAVGVPVTSEYPSRSIRASPRVAARPMRTTTRPSAPPTPCAHHRLISQAVALGPQIGQFAERLLDAPFPWSKLRQGQRLLRLAERYTPERLDAACARALGFDLVDVRRLERILVLALEHEGHPSRWQRSTCSSTRTRAPRVSGARCCRRWRRRSPSCWRAVRRRRAR
jgi:hypothetical protein